MTINPPVPSSVESLVKAFSGRPEVTAIALGGSQASQQRDEHSDYDLYIFTMREIPEKTRRDLALQFDPKPEISNTWFGLEDAWNDGQTGIDVSYWNPADFEHNLRRVIEHHQPSAGYSTSFWFTLHQAITLYDKDGWFMRMKDLTSSPYPTALKRAIVSYNAPLLRHSRASYRHQIELAVTRHDPVSVNHRVAALLASVFDIVFALNDVLHPGEKRQLEWIASLGSQVPPVFDRHVRELLISTGDPMHENILDAIDALCDLVDAMISEA